MAIGGRMDGSMGRLLMPYALKTRILLALVCASTAREFVIARMRGAFGMVIWPIRKNGRTACETRPQTTN